MGPSAPLRNPSSCPHPYLFCMKFPLLFLKHKATLNIDTGTSQVMLQVGKLAK